MPESASTNGHLVEENEVDKLLAPFDNIETELKKINEELLREETLLQAKYELKKAKLYKQRNEVISKTDKFWSTALENHPVLSSLIEMDDMDAIQHLSEINVVRDTDNPINYKIVFRFTENPYFSNEELVKEFDFSNPEDVKVTNHPINWKEGKSLVKEDLGTKGKEATAEEDDEEGENESFFKWFYETIQGLEIAEIIADDFFPDAVRYFANLAEDLAEEDDDGHILESLVDAEEVEESGDDDENVDSDALADDAGEDEDDYKVQVDPSELQGLAEEAAEAEAEANHPRKRKKTD
ncbi:hypothetical protein EV182_000143 [Spiromyces aspiralis]|uniref:Uncharacterized protein n=1 Tax=Spiromyces aspiralis TaxID=68401 RepID=A0ACC1HVK0_9FUNG|nr:hypothetical protein EV182_000143 [Spiromyces aspiralis]